MKSFSFEQDDETAVIDQPKTEPSNDLPPVLEVHKEKPTEPAVDDIAAILRGYKDVTDKSAPINTPQPQTIVGDTYKTGKKAGQPRKPRVTATFTPDQAPGSLSGELLTGALFLTLIDLLFPIVIAGINNRFSKDKINASALSLTEKQKKEIAPIADRVLKQINVQANPTLLLFLSVVGIYGANFAVAKMMSTKPSDKEDKK